MQVAVAGGPTPGFAGEGSSTLCVNSLFEEPWWLEAVAPDSWSACEVERDGQIAARLPYTTCKRHGLVMITRPPFTPALGPWVRAPEVDDTTARRALIVELVGRLPACDYLEHSLSPAVTDWLPFFWTGFDATVRYSSRLDRLDDPDLLEAGLTTAARRSLRKARSLVEVRDDFGIETMYQLVETTFRRQGLPPPWSFEQLTRLDEACAAHGARRMSFAVDRAGAVQASAYFVFDKGLTYYLFGGATAAGRAARAQSLLMWDGIGFAATVSQGFDFEGSMIEPIERFFRSFGARQVPYFIVRRTSRRAKLLFGLRDVAHAVRGR